MKKTFITIFCVISLLLLCSTAYAEKTTLYALDGRTLVVDENQVAIYTAEGMGWFLEKPVTMYSADGRTIVVPADRVEAHEAVGWFVKEEQPTPETPQQPEVEVPEEPTEAVIKYTDGTFVKVPKEHVSIYRTLGWVEVRVEFNRFGNVIIYNSEGNTREITFEELAKFVREGWNLTAPGTETDIPETPSVPETETITIYYYDGTSKDVLLSEVESYKAKAWGLSYDEAVYTYATLGDGTEEGAVALLADKKYEFAFRKVDDALTKIETGDSEYVGMLHSLRSEIVNAWRTAANSPLGFINYWFNNKDDKRIVVFEYRNVGDKQITYIGLNFDTCDSEGKVIETNAGSYFVNNLKLEPCDKTRVGWIIKSGNSATSVKNLRVKEVRYSDGSVWKAAE